MEVVGLGVPSSDSLRFLCVSANSALMTGVS
jgi:hypothetical protein